MGKKFNILLDSLPQSVTVNGRKYEVNTDYRVVLAYLRLLESDEEESVKRTFSLTLFFGHKTNSEDVKELSEWLGWFLMKGDEKEESSSQPVFDLLVDSNRIYAAFYQVYKINLRKTQMHWWTFSYLLEGLPSGTHLSDVIEIRGKNFEKHMSPAQRNSLQRLKDRYRIGDQQDLMGNVFDALMRIC